MKVAAAVCVLLAILAIPRYATFASRAKMYEAKTNLTRIFELEGAFHKASGAFTDSLGALPFQPSRQMRAPIYRYTLTTSGAGAFVARAVQVQQGTLHPCDNGADEWENNERNEMRHIVDGFASCTLWYFLVP